MPYASEMAPSAQRGHHALVPESVQNTFRRMLRDNIAPALRTLGLRGSGTTFSIQSDSHWALIGFQGYTSNTAASMKFTVNCKVVRRDEWAAAYEDRPYIGAKPKPNLRAGAFEWAERIGFLTPDAEDLWWLLSPSDDPRRVAAEVLDVITKLRGLSAVRCYCRQRARSMREAVHEQG